jgi:hypothetical protein
MDTVAFWWLFSLNFASVGMYLYKVAEYEEITAKPAKHSSKSVYFVCMLLTAMHVWMLWQLKPA